MCARGSQCLRVSQSLSECPRVSQNVPECPRVSQNVPECPRMSQSPSECPRMTQGLSECPRVSQSVPECPRVSQSVPECTGASQSVPECPRVCQSVPECPRVSPRPANIQFHGFEIHRFGKRIPKLIISGPKVFSFFTNRAVGRSWVAHGSLVGRWVAFSASFTRKKRVAGLHPIKYIYY